MSSNTETEKVEKGNAQCDDDARPQHGRIVDHLVPTTGEVEEGRTGSPCGHDGHKDDNGTCPEKAFKTYSIEGSDRVFCHDLFFNDELGCGANDGGIRGDIGSNEGGLLTRAERTRRKKCLLYFRRVG